MGAKLGLLLYNRLDMFHPPAQDAGSALITDDTIAQGDTVTMDDASMAP